MTPASECGSALIKWVSLPRNPSPKLLTALNATGRWVQQQRDASQRPDLADMALGINLKDLNDLQDGALFIGNSQKAGD